VAALRIREFRKSDAPALRTFWRKCGLDLRPGDNDRSLQAFAKRNRSLFVLAVDHSAIIGSALAGWDGRRGWLYHVATHPAHRRKGLAADLVGLLEERLRALGCPKVNAIVWRKNKTAIRFWMARGYREQQSSLEFGKEL
jgi:ribosomal protein S18 acetylase RimI-like enzyme